MCVGEFGVNYCGLGRCEIGWVDTAGNESPIGCARPAGETRPLCQ